MFDIGEMLAAIEELDYRYETGTGWFRAVPAKDRVAVAVAIVAHLGGNLANMRNIALVDGFLMSMQEDEEDAA